MQRPHLKLGEILVRQGAVNPEQVHSALGRQQSTDRRMGDLMISLGMATTSEVNAALAEQEWRQDHLAIR